MPSSTRRIAVALVSLGLLLSSSYALARTPQPERAAAGDAGPRVVDLRSLPPLAKIIPRLDGARVVFVGETHDRYDHHLSQLEVIRGLHARRGDIAIGMEFFQQPFQAALDDYVAGRIEERELLARTEYYERWRFDYRLYRPILQYAREHRIPLIALNLPTELTRKAGEVGLEGLDPDERAQVPAQIDRGNADYRERLRAIFEQHPQSDDQPFERWLDVQLLWDEGMAERASRYLTEHPGGTLVVLAGAGHLVHGAGIPDRVTRRSGARGVVILPADVGPAEPGLADFLLTSELERLPPAGRLGVMVDSSASGRLTVVSVEPGSGAEAAGLREGDELLAIDGVPLARFSDLRVALLDRNPGDAVQLEASRSRWLRGDQRLSVAVTLR
jgi:uncharacterized iron-regulated protein